jgi:hypothetical protein
MAGKLIDETSIRYLLKLREYGICVAEGGSSSVHLCFCPWCGAKLSASLRDEWFETLERL